MKNNNIKIWLTLGMLSVLTISSTDKTDVPQAEITNGILKVKLFLPDADNGYYRGTRFDWSGVIPSLEYKNHTFYGQWFDPANPTGHQDEIMGPVEEFLVVGYEEAKAGETFLKLGVGILTKPQEKEYSKYTPYKIANRGNWTTKKSVDQIQFTQVLQDKEYSYTYDKTVRLIKGEPQMELSHTLKNTGKRTIDTYVYDHNFFMIDSQPIGPGTIVTMPTADLSPANGYGYNDLVKFEGNQVRFLRDHQKDEHATYRELTDGKILPYNFKVESLNSGASVKITGDRPVEKIVLWSSSTTVTPEPYVKIKIEPGEEFSWKISYEYIVNDAKTNKSQ